MKQPPPLWIVLALAGSAGCLESRVDDTPAPQHVLPPGTPVPSVREYPEIAAQIDANDGVDALVPLRTAYVAGQPLGYYDFGAAPRFGAPVFFVMKTDADGKPTRAQGWVMGVIPGDQGYSPFWPIYVATVTDLWQGEIFPSVEALEEGQRLGLVSEPVKRTVSATDPRVVYTNGPVIAPGTMLEVGNGKPPRGAHAEAYYRGMRVEHFNFLPSNGPRPLLDGGVYMAESKLYTLRREGGAPLSEPIRNVDMTNDGDTKDTNDIFTLELASPDFTPLLRVVDVTVTAPTVSIEGPMPDVTSISDLFGTDGTPTSRVVSFSVTDSYVNRPLRSTLVDP
jgi:hypothetical protein